ncbi:MAG: type II toxin-antitoxin system RelE/ParE family toxin [Planctomycetota bacterium]
MNYRFLLPPDVENLVYDAALYIAEDNPRRAIAWVDEVFDAMRSICELPRASSVDEEKTAQLGREIRRKPFGRYQIFYEVNETDQRVTVVHFQHGARGDSPMGRH